MNTLWLLVARGGSKGVPGKNLRRIGGLTLVEWKIRAALAADPAAYIVCSSDSLEILTEAARLGARTIERPAELATDTAASADVIEHALATLATQGQKFDRVVLLEASAPFTRGAHYALALQMMTFDDADLIVGMKYTAPHPVFIGDVRVDRSITPIIVAMQRPGQTGRRRQDHPQTWTMAGNLYVFKTDMFMRTHDLYGGSRCYGLLTDKWSALEIDTPDDLEMAEYAYSKGYVTAEPL